MEPDLPGPSRPKRQKTTFKDPERLTNDELLAVLEDSDSEIELLGVPDTDDEDIFEAGRSESEESTDDDGEGRNIVFLLILLYILYFLIDTDLPPQLPQTHIQLHAPATTHVTGSVIPTWSSKPTGLKVFPFTKKMKFCS